MKNWHIFAGGITAAVVTSMLLAWIAPADVIEFDAPDQWSDGGALVIRDIGYFEMWEVTDQTAELRRLIFPMRESHIATRVEPGCYAFVTVSMDGRRSWPTKVSCSGGAEASLTDEQVQDLLLTIDADLSELPALERQPL